jgi:hypothetical protein
MLHPHLLGWILTDLLKRHPDAPISRWLLHEFGVRRGTTNNPPTRVDRLWRALAAAATAVVCLGVAERAITLTERFPAYATSSYVLTGIAIFAGMFGLLASLSTVIELARAPFSPPKTQRTPVAPRADRP